MVSCSIFVFPSTRSLSDFLRLAVRSSVSRALAALTSLFLDAFLVVSVLVPRNTWPHTQASFLTWIWLQQLGHARKKRHFATNTLNFNFFSRWLHHCTQGFWCRLCIENWPTWIQKPFYSVRSHAMVQRAACAALHNLSTLGMGSQIRACEPVLRLEYGRLALAMANESQHNSWTKRS